MRRFGVFIAGVMVGFWLRRPYSDFVRALEERTRPGRSAMPMEHDC